MDVMTKSEFDKLNELRVSIGLPAEEVRKDFSYGYYIDADGNIID